MTDKERLAKLMFKIGGQPDQIEYDNQGRLIKLGINFNQQLTSFPAEIGQLTNLQKLNLRNNQLTSLPAEIIQLTNLQVLAFENNHLSESDDVTGLGQDNLAVGPSLRALHALLNQVDSSHHWAGLTKVITKDGNILWLCDEHRGLYS
ncbi:leucine-rich repeat domain-containing protein [Anaerolineales bacterium HSG25]|nr:leucine-rich repeat domain-containing protein [Anaerolineales bacterium HSG25]